jgi:predicted cytidylate kinase
MRITISGPAGSGKTTVCNKLSEILSLESVVFGNIFRELASEKGISLSEMGTLAENDRSIDEMIDSKIVKIAREKNNIILESRLSAHMLSRNGIPAFKVYLHASPDVRIKRIKSRENEALEEALKVTMDRQASEERRYRMYYDIDINDTEVYDIIINTDEVDADQVVQRILGALEDRGCL